MTAQKKLRQAGERRERTDGVASRESLYDDDFYSWTERQAALLRAGHLDAIDIDNIIEEIETLGRSERSALQSAYRLIAMHLLKMRFQPQRYSRGWYVTITRERVRVARLLAENPGMKPIRQALLASAYADACKEAAAETGLPRSTFPLDAPFGLDQIEDEAFFPAEVNLKLSSAGSARKHKAD